MKNYILCAITICLLFANANFAAGFSNDFATKKDLKSYDFHEEKSLKENLAGVAEVFCPKLKTFIGNIREDLQKNLQWHQKLVFYAMESYAKLHLLIFNPLYLKDYINVVADLCDMSPQKGFLLYANLVYDLDARFKINVPTGVQNESSSFFGRMCTSVIFKDTAKNSIVLGSNLDLPPVDLSKLAYNINYYRKNELIYQSLNQFGIDGPARAISNKGKFFFAINTRRQVLKNDSLFNYFKEISFTNVISPAKLSESVIKNSKNFQEALRQFSDAQLTATVYFTIVGMLNNEDTSYNGCIIERNTESVNQTYCLNKDTWFLAQTNYDRSQPDSETDPRRTAIEKRIENVGRSNMTKEHLYEFLQTTPNFAHGENNHPSYTLTTSIGEIQLATKEDSFTSVWWDHNKN